MPAFRAAGVEQKIVEVPEHQMLVAFGRPRAAVRWLDLEKISQSSSSARSSTPGKPSCPTQLFDRLRRASAANVAAIVGSQILNNAPARGDSSTMSSPRRRI